MALSTMIDFIDSCFTNHPQSLYLSNFRGETWLVVKGEGKKR